MNFHAILRRLGLTTQEAAIYTALIENGAGTVSDIAKWSGLHRPIVYKHLTPLVEKGLIARSPRGKRTIFLAEPPEKLERLLEDIRLELSPVIQQLREMLPIEGKRPSMKYYVGKNGIRLVFADLVGTLKRGDTFYRYSSARESRDAYLPRNYRQERDRKQLQRFVITNEMRARTKKTSLDRSVKTISGELGLFEQDVTQLIYGNKVAVIDYNSETAIVIESKIIAEFQRKLFTVLYRKL
jgi:sugar-specific transcriptional regulator TrmB